MKLLLPLLWLFCACMRGLGEETANEDVRTRLYWVPPDVFPHDKAKPLPQRIDDSPWNAHFDVREFLTSNGIVLVPGEDAIYQSAARVLVVRAKRETLELVDTLGFHGCVFGNAPSSIRVEAVLVEFSAVKTGELTGDVPFDEMRKAAGDSWHVLNRTVVATKLNERMLFVSRSGSPEEKVTAEPAAKDQPQSSEGFGPLLQGESGTTFEVEPSLHPEGQTATLNLVYHFRTRGPEAINWEATISADVKTGSATMVQMNSAPSARDSSQPTKVRALIVRVDAIYNDDVEPQAVKQPTGVAAPPAQRQK